MIAPPGVKVRVSCGCYVRILKHFPGLCTYEVERIHDFWCHGGYSCSVDTNWYFSGYPATMWEHCVMYDPVLDALA